jgi:hypothetical protein
MNVTKARQSAVEVVAAALTVYAERRVFQGFSREAVAGSKAIFRIAWHRGRVFELAFDTSKGTLRLPQVLTGVPADSTMYQDLKAFIKARQSADLPGHRRIDIRRAQVRTYNRDGNISLVLTVIDGDVAYGVQKLIHLVHEIYMTFLADGNYFEYLVETFDLDPDRM